MRMMLGDEEGVGLGVLALRGRCRAGRAFRTSPAC